MLVAAGLGAAANRRLARCRLLTQAGRLTRKAMLDLSLAEAKIFFKKKLALEAKLVIAVESNTVIISNCVCLKEASFFLLSLSLVCFACVPVKQRKKKI